MYIFKTSEETFDSVITNQKHAFASLPANWFNGEIVLVSKNKKSCKPGEKQIQYIMRLENIRLTTNLEIDKYWPNNHDRWKYIVDCFKTVKLSKSFNLEDLIDDAAIEYKPVVTFKKIEPDHEKAIEQYLKGINAI